MTRLALIAALMAACGTQPMSVCQETHTAIEERELAHTVDPRVASDVAMFYEACTKYGAECAYVTVLVVPDEGFGIAGNCTGDGIIRINDRELYSPFTWAVVWHELGHCALDLRHTEIECPTLMLASISDTVLDNGTCTPKEYSGLLLRELVTADWCDAAARCGLL